MFCPSCEDEFRSSFTRCASCDVDLVESLEAVEQKVVKGPEPAPVHQVPMGELCGYFDLGEARHARDILHQNMIPAEISIRSSPETQVDGAVVEEYWLRADVRQIRQAAALIEQQPEPEETGGTFKCSNCDRPVREEESFCANCGMRFKE